MISENSVTLIIISILVILLSITVHEFMHGYMSYLLGDDTAKLSGRLSLNPIKHIDPITTVALPIVLILMHLPPFGAAKPVPFNPNKVKYDDFGVALVGIVGPISNLLLAGVGGLVIRIFGSMNSVIWVTWWWLFIAINIGFFIFNMIPFPPLDGSRVLYAFAPEFLQKIMIQIESFGFMAIIVFMFVIFPMISSVLQGIDQKIITILVGT